ncbi:unnamed protein product [Candida verbasci]|uniref:Uncharacterized protein n=1 Tax=Candida verbasci TaxID=1227364 RepID=A0A9W4XDU0_9ASCO|nr:unnamed protein product [Candida verbasci]
MPYTIGDRKISLDSNLTDSDKKLIITHSKIFKYCLNNAIYKYIINVKKIIHLYSDIITIYSTLLKKIPNYDDITSMTSKINIIILKLEDDFNEIFGKLNEENFENWEDKNYDNDIKPSCKLIINTTSEIFEHHIISNLSCIEIFFKNFNNLKKLLIPYLTEQTKTIIKSLSKGTQLFIISVIVDNITSESDFDLSNFKKIEKITTSFERESLILNTAFLTFNNSLKQYTSILLGKAILKRDIDLSQCELIKRRDICFQASEHVVSIPLTEEQISNKTMKNLSKYLFYIIFGLILLISIVFYRIFKVIVCR